MISLNTISAPATAAAIDGVLALIRVVSNPTEAKQYLDAIRSVIEEGGRAAAQAEAARHRADLEQQARALADRAAALDARQAELDGRAAVLEQGEQAVNDRIRKLNAALGSAAAA
jgi:spore germination cell wall hydrolase CwlJ-like protein